VEGVDDLEDKQSMAALAAGEDAALNRIIQRWQSPVRRFVFRYVQNEQDAEDLTQETFVRVYRHRNRYRPTGKFSTWLFTIAVNLCRNHAGKTRRRSAVHVLPDSERDAELVESLPDAAAGPADTAESAEHAAAVRAAIAELPHDLRTAVILFEYEQLSHAEIAAIESTSAKGVEMRLYRARQMLRRRLEKFLPR
jgi:RNA polymerase sigma-70 factor (ECF subfamily)